MEANEAGLLCASLRRSFHLMHVTDNTWTAFKSMRSRLQCKEKAMCLSCR